MADLATAVERCTLTELLVDQCAHCRRLPDPPARTVGKPFEAHRYGRCADCDNPYEPGDKIRAIREDGVITGILAECCWED